MEIDNIIEIVNKNSINNLKKKQETILVELKRLGLKHRDQYDLLEKISKVAKITKNPKTRASLIRSYFRTIREGIHKDGRNSSIVIEITKKCNKHCKHCYSNSPGKNQMMDDKLLNSIIDFARKNYKHIFLTGGEPTLDERVFLLAENNPDIMFFMFTNGSTINKEYAKKLSCYGNLIPLLSIDGNSESMHDRFKGKGSYKEIMKAIKLLNQHRVSWGYISMVTEINAEDVLSSKFVKDKKEKGAFIARYLEYLPVGKKANRELILSGEKYYLLEKRKKEIIESCEIYIQETVQDKCSGLLFFDVNGNIKNCVFFHYSKYNANTGAIKKSVRKTIRDWISYKYAGECPLYSDPIGFKNHLEKLGWSHIFKWTEEYLENPDISYQLMQNYQRFLKIKAKRNVSRERKDVLSIIKIIGRKTKNEGTFANQSVTMGSATKKREQDSRSS